MNEKVTYLVHCPSGPVYACEEHKRQLVNLFGVLGCHVGAEEVDPGHECKNCTNETPQTTEPTMSEDDPGEDR